MAVDEARIGSVIEAIYGTALSPERWPSLLADLAALFDSHFADAFARTDDWTQFHGLAVGLDRADYDDEFLGVWVKRNVWSSRHPVKVAGEVVSTRMMVPKQELIRSEMYNDYLAPRGLHEGMRLAIWSGEGWIQDISLLRSWSAGPFGSGEIALAKHLLPHLGRAACVARELRTATSLSSAGLDALDAVGASAFVLAADGGVLRFNKAAAALLAAADGLAIEKGQLAAIHPAGARLLFDAIARGLAQRTGASFRLPRPSGRSAIAVSTIPIPGGRDWIALRPPALLVVASRQRAPERPDEAELAELFGLTDAETDVAVALLAGQDAATIAAQQSRSVHTIRTHLSRLMGKTGTNRQSDLVRVLMQSPRSEGPTFR